MLKKRKEARISPKFSSNILGTTRDGILKIALFKSIFVLAWFTFLKGKLLVELRRWRRSTTASKSCAPWDHSLSRPPSTKSQLEKTKTTTTTTEQNWSPFNFSSLSFFLGLLLSLSLFWASICCTLFSPSFWSINIFYRQDRTMLVTPMNVAFEIVPQTWQTDICSVMNQHKGTWKS